MIGSPVPYRRPRKIRRIDYRGLPFPTVQTQRETIRETCRTGWDIVHEFDEPLYGGYNSVLQIEKRTTTEPVYAYAVLK